MGLFQGSLWREQGFGGQEAEELDNDTGRFLGIRVGQVFGFDIFLEQGFEIGRRGLSAGLRGRSRFQAGQPADIHPESAALGALVDFITEPAVETVTVQ